LLWVSWPADDTPDRLRRTKPLGRAPLAVDRGASPTLRAGAPSGKGEDWKLREAHDTCTVTIRQDTGDERDPPTPPLTAETAAWSQTNLSDLRSMRHATVEPTRRRTPALTYHQSEALPPNG
jgi:hypothetical protein